MCHIRHIQFNLGADYEVVVDCFPRGPDLRPHDDRGCAAERLSGKQSLDTESGRSFDRSRHYRRRRNGVVVLAFA